MPKNFQHLLAASIAGLALHSIAAPAPLKEAEVYPRYPAVNYGKNNLIHRGEYLAKMGDCIACHTSHAPKAKQFSGGFGIDTPFGTIYTPNITSDKDTGIGNWTDEEFIKAMREGVSPQHSYYYPAFPYHFFNKVTTPDLLAIKAYLMALPAVKQENQKNSMMFPFNIRLLQLGWRLLFFQFSKTGPYVGDPAEAASWNRGAYLVNGLGHCGMCHTPSFNLISDKYSLAAPDNRYAFSGAPVQGYYAPNITTKLLGSSSDTELGRVFYKDRLIGGGDVVGPMKEVNHDSLQYLSSADVTAIYTYLNSVKSSPKPTATASQGGGKGEEVYNQYCTGCHTTGAGGAPMLGSKKDWDPLIATGVKTLYLNANKGIRGMPAKGSCSTCTAQDIDLAVDFMVTQAQGGATSASTVVSQDPPATLSITDGKKVYDANCSQCHSATKPAEGIPQVGVSSDWTNRVANGGFYNVLQYTMQDHCSKAPYPACNNTEKLNGAQLKAAAKYMVSASKLPGNYNLW